MLPFGYTVFLQSPLSLTVLSDNIYIIIYIYIFCFVCLLLFFVVVVVVLFCLYYL